jgi:hypothetical protein
MSSFEVGHPYDHWLASLGGDVLQCADPLSWNQEARIVVRDNFDGVPLGDIANSLRPNLDLDLDLGFGSAGGKCCGVLGIADPLTIRRHSFTYSANGPATLIPARAKSVLFGREGV